MKKSTQKLSLIDKDTQQDAWEKTTRHIIGSSATRNKKEKISDIKYPVTQFRSLRVKSP